MIFQELINTPIFIHDVLSIQIIFLGLINYCYITIIMASYSWVWIDMLNNFVFIFFPDTCLKHTVVAAYPRHHGMWGVQEMADIAFRWGL